MIILLHYCALWLQEVWKFEFYPPVFKKVTLAGLNTLQLKMVADNAESGSVRTKWGYKYLNIVEHCCLLIIQPLNYQTLPSCSGSSHSSEARKEMKGFLEKDPHPMKIE